MGLSGLRQGPAYLKPSSGGGKFTPYISWSDGDAKTILFCSTVDEIAKVRIHNFVKVKSDNDRGFNYETFMCRKDPAWVEESSGECYLCDVLGHKAQERHCAIAVELDVQMKPNQPVVQSASVALKTFKRDDGTEVNYPQWGLIIQGYKNFFNYFTAFGAKYGSINQTMFDVSRVGGDEHTSYPIVALAGTDIPDLSPYEDQIPTLVEVLEKLGSKEKYDSQLIGAEEIEQTPDFTTQETGASLRTKFDELKETLPLDGSLESYGSLTAS